MIQHPLDIDEPRPHGEHPTLGKCDCDDCQLWDVMRRQQREYDATHPPQSR
jgi:hypothetical protein